MYKYLFNLIYTFSLTLSSDCCLFESLEANVISVVWKDSANVLCGRFEIMTPCCLPVVRFKGFRKYDLLE